MANTKITIDGAALAADGKLLIAMGPALDRARENLDDELSGWPTSTPGAGNATGGTINVGEPEHRELGHLDADPTLPAPSIVRDSFVANRTNPNSRHELGHLPTARTTTVERLIDHNGEFNDEALTAVAQIDELVERIHTDVNTLAFKLRKFGYVNTRATGNVADGIHCTQHLKLGLFFKIYQHGTNKTLCRWCYDFRSDLQRLPSLVLLTDKHNGIRITEAMKANDHPARRVTRTGKRKSSIMPETHKCPRPKCDEQIPLAQFACRGDWWSLPSELRQAINTAWRRITNGDADAIADHDKAKAAAVAYWRANPKTSAA